jgi:hypothetical protein
MNLENCNGCDTLATTSPIHADQDGPAFNEFWQYDSVIGMMMYLDNNTRPGIAYAIHQAARFTRHPHQSHAVGVKKMAQYLKQTKLEGMFISPQDSLRVECFVDADFASLFTEEDKQDPVSVKSRTGYVILFKGASLLWASKMQTQIALSTMEAEYIAISQAMRDIILIREVLKEIMTTMFQVSKTMPYQTYSNDNNAEKYNIPQSTVFEDNDACLQFGRMTRLTP